MMTSPPSDPHRRRLTHDEARLHDFELSKHGTRLIGKPMYTSACGQASVFLSSKLFHQLPQDGPPCPGCAEKAREAWTP